jgi:hypothetical protein
MRLSCQKTVSTGYTGKQASDWSLGGHQKIKQPRARTIRNAIVVGENGLQSINKCKPESLKESLGGYAERMVGYIGKVKVMRVDAQSNAWMRYNPKLFG